MTLPDMFLPSPSDLLVNLNDCKDLVTTLLTELPTMFSQSNHTQSALGAALQAAYKMASPTGGGIFNNCGSLKIGKVTLSMDEYTVRSKLRVQLSRHSNLLLTCQIKPCECHCSERNIR